MAGFFVGKEVKMKNYDWKYNFEKTKSKEHNKEQKAGGFTCSHCKQFIFINDFMGTSHRNHCNYCLWSKHVDLYKPGDRKATCYAGMKPIGLTFKNEGHDKYGKSRQGELKIVHWCVSDMSISTNRIAADDDITEIFDILNKSTSITEQIINKLHEEDIQLLNNSDRTNIRIQLLGK